MNFRGRLMTREQIVASIVKLLEEEFEIVNPDLDANLTEKYEFDSIDAIALLEHVEDIIAAPINARQRKRGHGNSDY